MAVCYKNDMVTDHRPISDTLANQGEFFCRCIPGLSQVPHRMFKEKHPNILPESSPFVAEEDV